MSDRELQLLADQALELSRELEALAFRLTTVAAVVGVLHDTLDGLATGAYADRQDQELLTREGAV